MAAFRKNFQLCIWGAGGRILGAGWLASGGVILTCHHVINGHMDNIWGDFPLLDAKKRIKLNACQKYSCSVETDINDIAVLKAVSDEFLPEGALSASVCDPNEQLYNRSVTLYGFPEKLAHGDSVKGILKDSIEGGWVQIDYEPGQRLVCEGFSGTAVWDTVNGVVVGMAVATKCTPDGITSAYMIPISILAKAWPYLAAFKEKLDEKRPGLVPIITKMCNRDPQDDDFCEQFITRCKERRREPQFYVIHGKENECHDSLVRRLESKHIKRFITKGDLGDFRKRVIQRPFYLPLTYQRGFEFRKRQLQKQLLECFGGDVYRHEPPESVAELCRLPHLCERKYPVIILSHRLDAKA